MFGQPPKSAPSHSRLPRELPFHLGVHTTTGATCMSRFRPGSLQLGQTLTAWAKPWHGFTAAVPTTTCSVPHIMRAGTASLAKIMHQHEMDVRVGSQFRSFASKPPSQAVMEPIQVVKEPMRGGPITLAEYMADALTSPQGGFYMSRDVFGTAGDFITSPEISQTFGEMVGIWCVYTWMQMGKPEKLSIAEMGPGRGTLMADVLRSTAGFKDFASSLEVHFVEMSPALRKLQFKALKCFKDFASSLEVHFVEMSPALRKLQFKALKCREETPLPSSLEATPIITAPNPDKEAGVPQAGVSGFGANASVTWHSTLNSVSKSTPTVYIAHEFFDALPVHQFVKDPKRGWLEKLVDVEDSVASASLAPADTSTAGDSDASVNPAPDQDPIATSSTGTPSPSSPVGVPEASTLAAVSSDPSGNFLSETTSSSDASSDASDPMPTSPHHFRLVLSPSATPAATLLVPRRLAYLRGLSVNPNPSVEGDGSMGSGGTPPLDQEMSEVQKAVHEGQEAVDGPAQPPAQLPAHKQYTALEVCAQGMATAESLAQRIGAHGGAALIIDYGKDEPGERARGQCGRGAGGLVGMTRGLIAEVLDPPGASKYWISLAVDESGAPATAHGPVSQSHFLRTLGIETRLQKLQQSCSTPSQAAELAAAVQRLLEDGPKGMGYTYQVMAITHRAMPIPAAFEPTVTEGEGSS
eukprot:gene16656-22908_t